jgi:hypothetical protein
MKQDKRKPRGLWPMIAADPLRKLASVALAIGLWFFLNSQITRDLPLRMPLTTVGNLEAAAGPFSRRLAIELPTNRVVGRGFYDANRAATPIEDVVVTLSGPRYLIDNLEGQRLDLRITKFVGTDWSERTSIEFTAADIDRNLRALQDEDVRISIDPPSVRLDVEKIQDRAQTLSLDDVELVQLDPTLEARLRRDTAKFAPDTVRILGPAGSLAAFPPRGTKPFRARLGNPGNAKEATAILELAAAPELGLRLAETPSVSIQLMPVTRIFEVELPIVVDDAALSAELRGTFRPEKETALVRIRAGGTLMSQMAFREAEGKLSEFAAEYLRLDVFLERPTPGAPLGSEFSRVARLSLRGTLQDTVEPTDYKLDQPLLVRLIRKP